MDKDNVTMPEPVNDELAQLIIERLSERQRKTKRMEEWEQKRHNFRLDGRVVAFMAAACVALLLVFAPWRTTSVNEDLGIEAPSMEMYRSASPDMAEISKLMEKPDYEAALTVTAKALRHSEMELNEFKDVYDYDDEEMQYEEEQERLMNSELRWTYIYLLVQTEQYKDAIKELKIYLKRMKYCEHENEARTLLQALKKK